MVVFKLRRLSKKAGLAPGSLVHVGEKVVDKTTFSVIDYDESHYDEKIMESVEDCLDYKDRSSTSWINVNGIHDVEVISMVGSQFGIHDLVLEDILNTESRPKMEDYDDYLFFILKMFYYNKETKELTSEQVSLLVIKNNVITFQEQEGDVFEGLRKRLRGGKGTIRKRKSDYLTYAIIDAIVDMYFTIMEQIGADIESLQDRIMDNPKPESVQSLHLLRQDVILLKKSVWPLRELVNNFQRIESGLVQESTQHYLRDLYDHTIQVLDTIDSYRESISSLFDIYLSNISQKTNEVMKILTMIAMIFIPTTFIAGIYGMNFEFMPELSSPYGYPSALAAMAIIAGSLLFLFKRKSWI